VFEHQQNVAEMKASDPLEYGWKKIKRGFFQCGCRFPKSALPAKSWSSAAATVLVATLALARKNHGIAPH